MAAKIYLPVVDAPDPHAIIVHFTPENMLIGDDPEENLACGSCKRILGRNLNVRTAVNQLADRKPNQFLIKCSCGSHVMVRDKIQPQSA